MVLGTVTPLRENFSCENTFENERVKNKTTINVIDFLINYS
jgi:hypothetical protein